MNLATANDTIPDIQTEAHEIAKRQMETWFKWMDRILDIHRANFVFREATPRELVQHKTALGLHYEPFESSSSSSSLSSCSSKPEQAPRTFLQTEV